MASKLERMGFVGLTGEDCKQRFEQIMNIYIDAVEIGRQAESVPFFNELEEISKMTDDYLAPPDFKAPPAPWGSQSSSDEEEEEEEEEEKDSPAAGGSNVLGKRRRSSGEDTVTLDSVVESFQKHIRAFTATELQAAVQSRDAAINELLQLKATVAANTHLVQLQAHGTPQHFRGTSQAAHGTPQHLQATPVLPSIPLPQGTDEHLWHTSSSLPPLPDTLPQLPTAATATVFQLPGNTLPRQDGHWPSEGHY